jgi:cobalamin biosynthesis protein CobW
MLELLKRRDSLDCILLETSGLALPKPLVKAFHWHEIRNAATVDGVVTVVDCEAVSTGAIAHDLQALEAQRQADPSLDHETPIQELFEDQLACADLVVLNKTDLVDETARQQVIERIQQELPRAVKIVTSHQGKLEPDVLLGFQAAVEDHLETRPSHHDLEEDHEHDDEINSTHLVLAQEFEPKRLRQQLESLVQQQEIYRVKGFVSVPHKPMRMVVQGVGNRFEQYYDRPWRPNELRQTQLVFIGRRLDEGAIVTALMMTNDKAS